jgi:hypothetical protein
MMAGDSKSGRNMTATRLPGSKPPRLGTTLTDAIWIECGAGSKMSAEWAETLMGFEPGWTSVDNGPPREGKIKRGGSRHGR